MVKEPRWALNGDGTTTAAGSCWVPSSEHCEVFSSLLFLSVSLLKRHSQDVTLMDPGEDEVFVVVTPFGFVLTGNQKKATYFRRVPRFAVGTRGNSGDMSRLVTPFPCSLFSQWIQGVKKGSGSPVSLGDLGGGGQAGSKTSIKYCGFSSCR